MKKLLKKAAAKLKKPPTKPDEPGHRGYGYDKEYDAAGWLAYHRKRYPAFNLDAVDPDAVKNVYVRMALIDQMSAQRIALTMSAARQTFLTDRTLHVARGGRLRELPGGECVPVIEAPEPPPEVRPAESKRTPADKPNPPKLMPKPAARPKADQADKDPWGFAYGTRAARLNQALADSGKWCPVALLAKRAKCPPDSAGPHLSTLFKLGRVERRKKEGKLQYRIAAAYE